MLYGSEGGMETCREGVELGKDRERMEVWDSRAEGGAGGWGRSQDESPSDAIYSSPSWAILAGPDHHQYYPSISPLLIFSSYPETHLLLNHVISVYSWAVTLNMFHPLREIYDS